MKEIHACQNLKINVVPGQTSKSTTEQGAVDFEMTAHTGSTEQDYEWQLEFKCPDQWKWSDEAPHTWRLTSYGIARSYARKLAIG